MGSKGHISKQGSSVLPEPCLSPAPLSGRAGQVAREAWLLKQPRRLPALLAPGLEAGAHQSGVCVFSFSGFAPFPSRAPPPARTHGSGLCWPLGLTVQQPLEAILRERKWPHSDPVPTALAFLETTGDGGAEGVDKPTGVTRGH